MKRSMSESELLRLADLNLIESWCEGSKWVPNSEIVQCQETVFINSVLDLHVTVSNLTWQWRQ